MRRLIPVIFVLLASNGYALKVTSIYDIKGNEAQITEIDFSNKGLIDFPSEILKCVNLKVLNLSNNGLINLPQELGALTSLKSLNLSVNQGLSPTDLDLVLKNATFQLETLELANCNLLFLSSDISKNSNLQTLNLSGNRLQTLPYSMMGMTRLKNVNLSNNYFHELAWMIGNWWSLKTIDISDNPDLEVAEVLVNLSYLDQLDELTAGPIYYFPKEFDLLNVHRVVIKNSTVGSFPRSEFSRPIDELVFDNCHFTKTGDIIAGLNSYGGLNFVEFKNIAAAELVPFLELAVDSVSLKNLSRLDIWPMTRIEQLKWIDLRGTTVDATSLQKFKIQRPDVAILEQEKIDRNIGVAPPLPQYVSKPMLETIQAGEAAEIILGKATFEFSENTIVDVQGNPYEGPVILEYQEFMTPEDIFFSGITMTSDEGDETMLFSSGGMFNLEATDPAGNELFVNPEEPVSVQLFSGSDNPDMNLYRLNEQGSWELAGKDSIDEPFQLDQAKLDSVMGTDFMEKARAQVRFVSDRYMPVIKRNRKYKSFEISFRELKTYTRHRNEVEEDGNFMQVFNTDYVGHFISEQRFLFEGDSVEHYFSWIKSMSKFCRKQYGRMGVGDRSGFYNSTGPNFIGGLELVPDLENDRFNLKFKFKNSKVNLPVNVISTETQTQASLKETRVFYKHYLKAWRQAKKVMAKNKPLVDVFVAKQTILLKEQALMEEKDRQFAYWEKTAVMREAAGEGSIIRAFEVNGFGTWNCDVRTRMSSPRPVAPFFVTSEGDKLATENGKVVVIDHDRNGVVQFENKESAFFDSDSKTTLVVFFSAALVGIYQSWKNKMDNTNTELKLLNIEGMNKEKFLSHLKSED